VSRSPGISICLLCYNDATTIGPLVDSAAAALDELGADGEIVVVDDGSTDDSAQRLSEAARRQPRLRVVTHAENRGYGAAIRSALGAARGDWAFYTDGDGQYRLDAVPDFARRATDAVDVVQGYKRERADSLLRRVVGTAYQHFVRIAFGLRIRDPDCDFRLIRKRVSDQLELTSSTGAICVELVRRLQEEGARFVELPVDHYARSAGRSQFFRPVRIARSLLDLTGLWIKLIARPALRRAG
jgi:glycosyltransferase involved in cell wall biosynthesis